MLPKILEVFALGMFVDIIYIILFRSVTANKPFQAALSSMLLTTCSLFGFISIVDEHRLTIPYLLGIGTGAYVAVVITSRGKNGQAH